MRKFEITVKIDGFDGELSQIITAQDRGQAESIVTHMLDNNDIEFDVADVGKAGV